MRSLVKLSLPSTMHWNYADCFSNFYSRREESVGRGPFSISHVPTYELDMKYGAGSGGLKNHEIGLEKMISGSWIG